MAAIKRIELNGEVEREQIRIYTFGGFRWRLGGDPLEVPIGRPARELLAHLALSTGARRSRDALVGRFWPELSDRVARKQLSQAVWRANSAVRERLGQQLIVGRGEELHLAAEVWCDAVEATRLFGLGKDSAAERIVVLEEAVGLTSGRFLEGHRSAWADELAADYEASARGARRELIRLHRASGHPVAALRHAELLEVQFGDSGALLARADLLAELGRFDEATSIIERVQSGDLDQGEQRHFERLRRRIRRSLSAPTPSFGRLPFAGRNDERSRILSHLGRRTDDVRLVLLQGVPGIGKTRMLEELTGDLRWRGWEVLAATATTEHGPFGVLSDALADALTPARSRLLSDRVEPVFLGQAAGVLESLAPMVQERAASVDGREALLRTSESVCRIVEGLAAERPTTLIVDDVHIADPGTLSVLRRLPHLLAGRSVTLVVSFRAEEARARDEVWDVLEFLDRKPGALRHELVPLGREATRSLVDAVLGNGGETLVDAVHRASNGIPLAVSEALRRIASEPQSAPAELTGALASRMDSFGRDQRTLLEIAALMGTEASVDPLLECSNLDHGDALRALDTLLEDGVLRSRRLIYEFSHSLIRETVYEAIEVDRRVELHRLAADVLDRKGAHAGVVAQHREAGGQADEAAMLYLQAARDAGRANAFTGASDGYQRALRVLEDGHPAELDIIHEYDEILKIFGDEEGRRALLARLLTYDGRGQADGRALWRMADISAGSNAFEEAILYAKRATEWAKTTGDQALLATAARTEGEALSLLGDQSGAVERLQLAADLS
ncbi:MAG: AAA family ATPase, partial [Acidimicrobiia bacterium]|nr:AAA family ATPase [Acidimicrobiia bacterium]